MDKAVLIVTYLIGLALAITAHWFPAPVIAWMLFTIGLQIAFKKV